MKEKLIQYLKYNKFIYSVYYNVFNTAIKGFGVFLKNDPKLILFSSFGGKKFDDSPKAIYRKMRKDPRFKDYKLVWAFHEPEEFKKYKLRSVKTDTFKYFKTALQARVWITNSSMERGLNFKKKETLYFNTWHGTPMKKMGTDIADNNTSFSGRSTTQFDVMCSQSRYETDIFSRVYGISKSHFLEKGIPRNDELCGYTHEDVLKIKNKLGIPEDKKVILYCPTFREYERDDTNAIVLVPPMDLEKWRNKLGDEYVLLFRAHYEVAKAMKIQNNDFVRDMTDYPALNDLMIAADILISDYSSVLFDYSITEKTMFHFCYDYQKYVQNRGVYFDIRDYISGADSEDGMIELILTHDEKAEKVKTIKFRDDFVNFYGNAAEACVNCIAKKIKL